MKNFLTEDNGRLSSMRLALLVAVFIVMGVWSFISIRTMSMQPVPAELTAVIGLLAGGKAMQKRWEQSPPQTPTAEGTV